MTTTCLVARNPTAVKSQILTTFSAALGELLLLAEGGTRPRCLEIAVWKAVFALGRAVLSCLLGLRCLRSTEEELRHRGLSIEDVRLRTDKDYWAQQSTTFGKVSFPLFAYREVLMGAFVTKVPARREVLPLCPRVRSSELLLERECWLAKEFPFRRAEEALSFLSHGEVRLEDTTIRAHMRAVGSIIERRWLYRPVAEIKELLSQRATRDQETGRPIVYLSTDAHTERLYVDDTWDAAWKCANGIRLWIVDRRTSAIVHVGGEFTWGDCHEVGTIIDELIEMCVLPREGDYGDGVLSTLVVITDGMPWIEDHVLSRLSWALPVLDLYHALEKLGDFSTTRFPRAKAKASAWYQRLAVLLVPRRGSGARGRKPRLGHTKRRREQPSQQRAPRTGVGCGFTLLGSLYDEAVPKRVGAAFDKLLNYFEHNAYRMDYARYDARGFQLGSGAMESMHRSGGQLRLKIPGGRWLRSTSQAIFNLRMLDLAGQWTAFWEQPDLHQLLAHGLNTDATPKDAAP